MGWKYIKQAQRDGKSDVNKGYWSEQRKHEILKYYLSCGSYAQTSREMLISIKTLDGWKTQDWWKDGVKEYKQGNLDVLDAKLTQALDLALDNVIDRIEKGETVYDPKTGKQRVVPAKLRDLNVAFNTLLDKRQLIRKEPTKIIEQQTTAAQLQNLANQFSEFVTGRIKQEKAEDLIELIEGETVFQQEDGTYALHDQREERLQERAELGAHEEEDSREGQGSTQWSPR